MYVLVLGPLEWFVRRYGWTDSPVARIFSIVYYPLVFLTHVTGTLDWLAACVDWCRELG